MQRDLARDGDAAKIRAQIEAAGLESEGFGKRLEAFAAGCVKGAFLVFVVGAAICTSS